MNKSSYFGGTQRAKIQVFLLCILVPESICLLPIILCFNEPNTILIKPIAVSFPSLDRSLEI